MNYTDIRLERGFVVQEKVAALTEHELHTHDVLEISIPLENEIRYTLLSEDYDAGPGDVFLFRPFEPHWNLIREGGQPARWVMLLFTPSIVANLPEGSRLLVPFYRMDMKPLIPADSPEARAIGMLARTAAEEGTAGRSGWELLHYTVLIQVLIHIHRYYEKQAALVSGSDMAADGIVRAVEYLIAHGAEAIDMDEVMRMTGNGKTRFYGKFKELTGVTPHDFLIRLRLQMASHKLRTTEESVLRIALDCGFGSSSYFNKVFKQFYGMTPREYRRR